ncbi:hypothetical protein PanWU01x14_332640, partial [Parasponia andersonii]
QNIVGISAGIKKSSVAPTHHQWRMEAFQATGLTTLASSSLRLLIPGSDSVH